jgi:hypothetical protein
MAPGKHMRPGAIIAATRPRSCFRAQTRLRAQRRSRNASAPGFLRSTFSKSAPRLRGRQSFFPHFADLQTREAERRQAHLCFYGSAPRTRMLPPGCASGAARLSAFHRGSRLANQRHRSAPNALPGTRPGRALAALTCPSPASFSQTGHRAGRAFARSRPGADRNSARGHRSRSASGSTLGRRRPSMSEIRGV